MLWSNNKININTGEAKKKYKVMFREICGISHGTKEMCFFFFVKKHG